MSFVKINHIRTPESAYAAYKAGARFASLDLDGISSLRIDEAFFAQIKHLAPIVWIGFVRKHHPVSALLETLGRLKLKGVQINPSLYTNKEIEKLLGSPFYVWFSFSLLSGKTFFNFIEESKKAYTMELYLPPLFGYAERITSFLENLPPAILRRTFIEGVHTQQGIKVLSKVAPLGFSFSSQSLQNQNQLDVDRISFAIRALHSEQIPVETQGTEATSFSPPLNSLLDLSNTTTEWQYLLNAHTSL